MVGFTTFSIEPFPLLETNTPFVEPLATCVTERWSCSSWCNSSHYLAYVFHLFLHYSSEVSFVVKNNLDSSSLPPFVV
jgi:hypothetical protein